MKMLVLSCDKYNACWKPFFTLLNKYYKNHPKAYIVSETKKCEYCDTINVNSECWTERFRKALEQIDDEYVLIMLDDFFIRDYVDEKRIKLALETMKKDKSIGAINFEKNYRQSEKYDDNWELQANNQIFLNSCQPSLCRKSVLIERLQENLNAWQWEEIIVDSKYKYLINNKDFIINIAYEYKENGCGFSIYRGKITKEIIKFLVKEHIDLEELLERFDIC